MKIQYSNARINFGRNTRIQKFEENPKNANFVKNVTLNSAIEVMHYDNSISFLPSGSWITGVNYDPELSDHDLTILMPNNCAYEKMEAKTVEARTFMKNIVLRKFEEHKLTQADAQQKLSTINIFPTPQVKEIFDSYDQFRKYTNLKLSLNDSKDADKGLWQMKSALVQHFKNEGDYITLKSNGKLEYFKIKGNEDRFFKQMDKKKIYMPKNASLYNSDRLKIIGEFIDTIQNNPDISKRSFYKYLQRVGKFFFAYAQDDLFLISKDQNKRNLPKYQNLIKEENNFFTQYNKISQNFDDIKKFNEKNYISENNAKSFLKDLVDFRDMSYKILERPLLKGFKA